MADATPILHKPRIPPRKAMMKKPINYFWPAICFLFGFTIMLSPTGRAPRMGYEFHEYKYIAGFAFVAICFLLLMNLKEK